MAAENTRLSAEPSLYFWFALATPRSASPPSSTTDSAVDAGTPGRVRRERVEERARAREVIAHAQLLDRRAVDRDDLGAERHLRRADVEVLDVAQRSGSRDATSVTRSVFVDVSATTPPRTMHVAAPDTCCCGWPLALRRSPW